MRLNILIISLFVVKTYSQSNFEIISDFGPEDCDKTKNLYYTNSLDGSGVPGCYKAQGLNNPCSVKKVCAPGLKCIDNYCEIDEDSCAKYDFLDNKPKWLKCLPDGSYAPVQCKGEHENGRCYCYNRLGKRIFGETWSYESQNMTCACSRARSELELQGRNDVTLHCDSMGNYERLQCESGTCWCADTKTGKIEDSVVPEALMKILPCYDRIEVGSMYLRKCESEQVAQAVIKNEFSTHGTLYVTLPFINCDWDGSYGRFKVESGQLYCTWRDNTNLGSYADQITSMNTINCNCARDTKYYELAGKKLSKYCSGNGNYKKLQHYGNDEFYCVDEDGFAVTDPAKDLTEEMCP